MTQKFIDRDGLKALWNQVNLKDYPNNETLMAVIDAIDETKADKDELFSKSWNDLTDRPFYEEEINGEVFLDVEMDKQAIYDCATFLQLGETYKVTVGTEEYILEAQSALNANLFGGEYIYLGSTMTSRGLEGDYSFSIYKALEIDSNGVCLDTTPEQPIFVKVEGLSSTEVHQLDEKYIPDTIARVEYVDNAVANAGGGVQSDWNQNDENADDYVKNRPFYTENEGEITEIIPETTFTIDNEGMWHSEKFAVPIEAGNTYICKYNGVEYICTAFSYTQDGIEGIILGNMGKSGADFEDTGEPFVIVTVPAENMTMVILHDGTVSTNITCSITMNNEIIHKLPNKYLDLDWKPTKEYKLTDVFPINNVTFTGKEITLIDSQVFYLHVGEEYTVNWNGTEHVCEAKRIDADPFSVFYIGNTELTTLTGKVDTGEPFIYWYLADVTNSVIAFAKLTKEDTTTETVAISVKGYTDVYNKIPTNFLPDSYVIPTDIDAGLVINELRLADKAFQEGRRVYARKGGVFGQVIYLGFDSVDSIFNQMWFVSDSKMFYIWSYEYGSTNGVAKTNYIVVGLVPDISGTRGYSVPVPSEMKAGQMVRLKSIDESKASGYNMAWEAVDPWVIESSTAGSTKKFKLTVDDSGTISTTEVTE